MNMMEVASVFDASGRGGKLLLCRYKRQPENFQRAPLQFTLSAEEVVGFLDRRFQPGTWIEGPEPWDRSAFDRRLASRRRLLSGRSSMAHPISPIRPHGCAKQGGMSLIQAEAVPVRSIFSILA